MNNEIVHFINSYVTKKIGVWSEITRCFGWLYSSPKNSFSVRLRDTIPGVVMIDAEDALDRGVATAQPEVSLSSTGNCLGTPLPSEWQPVLATVHDFVRTLEVFNQKKNAKESTAYEEQQLRQLHERIAEQRDMLLEDSAITNTDISTFRFVIAKSFIIQAALKWGLSADDLYLDLAGSQTLGEFTSDYTDEWSGTLEHLDALCEFCKDRMLLSAEEVARLKEEVNDCLLEVDSKKALVKAIQEEFRLYPQADDIEQMQVDFFNALYPGAQVAAGDVKLIVTSTMIFICLPLDEAGGLTCPSYGNLTGPALEKTDAFLADLKKFTQGKFANFPAFGFLDQECCKSESLQRIAENVGVEPQDVYDSLRKMVTILPLREIDKYVVHDVWGHGWQATMLGFDHFYNSLARYAQPLDLGEGARSPVLGNIRFIDCFTGTGPHLRLDEQALRQFLVAEIEERLPLAMAPVFAEMMADMIEFKFAKENPALELAMQNSSLFPHSPTKLDLSLADVSFYFSQATKIFRLWAEKENRQQRTINQVMTVFRTDEATARNAIRQATKVWRDLSAAECSEEIHVVDTELGAKPNVIARWYLNTVGIHHAVAGAFSKLDTMSTSDLPLRSFKEMLVLSASIFFEQNPRDNFWKIDEFISQWFVPLCSQFAGTVRTPEAGGAN